MCQSNQQPALSFLPSQRHAPTACLALRVLVVQVRAGNKYERHVAVRLPGIESLLLLLPQQSHATTACLALELLCCKESNGAEPR